ncbi:MAG: NAD(P)H-dependent oxidoreductase [Ruminococcus sp.]|nr:NAD(P)H-dependent oxidoreductase [Oscillospiraceae bacterium]MBR6986078.1 NAD(P)H-dependent oxidoreductase [Ruminococcus sp.]
MRALVIYFSRADENYAVGYIDKGNTEIVAEFVQELAGADMFKVEPAVPYAADYQTCIEEAKQRIGNAPIKKKLTDISAYDTVFIMSPIYWGTYAPEVETALTGLDFTGKTVRVISTHEGSGLGSMVSDVKKICKGANVDSKGLAVKGSSAKSAKATVEKWL